MRAGRRDEVVSAASSIHDPEASARPDAVLSRLAARIVEASEAERARVASLLHDEISQTLCGAGIYIDLLRMDFGRTHPELGARLEELQQLLERVIHRAREIHNEYSATTVERAGLCASLEALLERNKGRFAGGATLVWQYSGELPPKTANALYQIGREAVENAIRHAGCTLIELSVRAEGQAATLEIRDNGKGFEPSDLAGPGCDVGVLSMKHLAERGGLRLALTSERGKGAVVSAIYEPLESSRKSDTDVLRCSAS